LPNLIHSIPLAALGAMLVYTGTRLAHPHEFIKNWNIGKEQLLVFLVTIAVTLATDLLIGIAAGVVIEFLLHLCHGMPLREAIRPRVDVETQNETEFRVVIYRTAVFTNWLPLKSRLAKLGTDAVVTLDLTHVRYVDHTVMEKLHELEAEYLTAGGRLRLWDSRVTGRCPVIQRPLERNGFLLSPDQIICV